jgi:hypothetical protein
LERREELRGRTAAKMLRLSRDSMFSQIKPRQDSLLSSICGHAEQIMQADKTDSFGD